VLRSLCLKSLGSQLTGIAALRSHLFARYCGWQGEQCCTSTPRQESEQPQSDDWDSICGGKPVPSLSVLCFRGYSGGSGERLSAFILRTKKKTKTKTTTKRYLKMPAGLRTRARTALGVDGVAFDPALWELDPKGNVLRKVAVVGEDASAGTAAKHADLMTLLQAAETTAELRETEAALERQMHSDDIAAHSLNATLSGKDEEIARLEALWGTEEEGEGGVEGGYEEADAELGELKRKLREQEASEARLMAARKGRAREDSQAQSQIEQLIGIVSTLAARQEADSAHLASSTATAQAFVTSRSKRDGVD
jgi:hypothetical protein